MENKQDNIVIEPTIPTANPFALFVPLYLVILAFFILLNSISVKNHVKTEGVVSSIEKTFSSGVGRSNFENKALFFDFSQIVTTYFDDIESELKNTLKIEDTNTSRKGYKMSIKIPLKKVFKKESSQIIELKKTMIDRIVKTIALERQGVLVNINIKIDSRGFVSSGNSSPFKIDEERSQNIVRKFIASGISIDNIKGGLTFNNERNLIIETQVKKAAGAPEGANIEQ